MPPSPRKGWPGTAPPSRSGGSPATRAVSARAGRSARRICPSTARCAAAPGYRCQCRRSSHGNEQHLHLTRVLTHAHEHGPGNDGMADVELADPGNRRDRTDVAVIETVTRVDTQALAGRVLRRGTDPVELFSLFARTTGFGIASGVQLDYRRAGCQRGVDLLAVGIDEKRDPDARCAQIAARVLHALQRARHVESAFGSELGTSLRHQADVMRPHAPGEPD